MKTILASLASYGMTGYAINSPGSFNSPEKIIIFITAAFITVLHILNEHQLNVVSGANIISSVKNTENMVKKIIDSSVKIIKDGNTTPIS